ncbi:hypothetical protein [Pseudohalioglobus lutimaris]|uniref:SGNH hydrolase-type esterase domain-containing protein n=1 Tax=Pseudohalioglobus lutimaris TaxID=1737061 RepID=A0A2N5X2E7_9GAMM|nr:hypothetical protein [Pseudohalioglobus lutimaris]PLW68665.1 hypothetical protein C0039_11680 [Pseudohalioglobus lutimaris]
MISWKLLRTCCLVLLLIPIAHLIYMVSRDTVASMNSSPDAWAAEVEAYARQDRISQLPKDPIVIVGGRRVKLWSGLDDLLAPKPVLVRGLGEATVDDLSYHYNRLIGFYQPDTVVLLPDNSEFHIRANNDAETLVHDIGELVELDASQAKSRRFVIIAPLKTPLYPSTVPVIDETLERLEAWAPKHDNVTLIDANTLLSKADGMPNPAYYRADGVNLNEHGYVRLSVLLQMALRGDL